VQLIRFGAFSCKVSVYQKNGKDKTNNKTLFFCNSFFCVTCVDTHEKLFFISKKVFFVQLYATCFAISTAHTNENAFREKKLNAKIGVTQNRKIQSFLPFV
jgi:hypothetical protein